MKGHLAHAKEELGIQSRSLCFVHMRVSRGQAEVKYRTLSPAVKCSSASFTVSELIEVCFYSDKVVKLPEDSSFLIMKRK